MYRSCIYKYIQGSLRVWVWPPQAVTRVGWSRCSRNGGTMLSGRQLYQSGVWVFQCRCAGVREQVCGRQSRMCKFRRAGAARVT